VARFQAIACDYDSTLAHEGRVAPETVEVLRRARAAGKKLILITGRRLKDLESVFAETSVFDLIVAENGGLLVQPTTKLEEPLCAEPPGTFVAALSLRQVPLSVGKAVVATHRPYETVVQEVIDRLNLDLAITFNRESVMVLPRHIDKASGLTAALNRLEIQASQVVGIGDAENDFSFLRRCGFSVAVANAIESLKNQVDHVTLLEDGAGASKIIEQVIAGSELVGGTD
jgi:hydroxymethylpyrimidine pyrophosphatase-like HAD family hydrolase